MTSVGVNFDLIYSSEGQYRRNHPAFDPKKHLWLFSIDSFSLRNVHNGELTTFEIPEASKFLMVVRVPGGVLYLATPDKNRKFIYKYMITFKDLE